MNIATILEHIPPLARAWAAERAERQQRTTADPADYKQLRSLGVPLLAVPVEFGGTWESLAQSARPICTLLRTLAQGDPSITLASAMHHGVLGSWRIPAVPEPYNQAWQQQRQEVFQTVLDGAWWGTIVSEPGSDGSARPTVTPLRFIISPPRAWPGPDTRPNLWQPTAAWGRCHSVR